MYVSIPKVIPSITATVWLLLIQTPVFAVPIPIEFVPQNQVVELGNQVTVDVVTTPGLDSLGLPILVTEFDIIVNWDITLMALADITFGSALGGGGFNSLQSAFDLGGGSANAAELSLLFDFTGLQDGSAFTLFSLTFDTLAIGTSALNISRSIMGDFFGAPLEAAPGTGSIEIIEATAIPEPSTLLLFITGLVTLVAARRRRL